MIDTIKIRVDGVNSNELLNNGIKWKAEINETTGEIIPVRACLENIQLRYKGISLYIEGSLPKLILGNNVETLRFDQVKEVIKILETQVGIDLTTAIVTRIDLASTIEVSRPVSRYLPLLDSCPRFVRNRKTKTSISFDQKQVIMKFYDKSKEVEKKEGYIIEEYQDKNLLRYELVLCKSAIKRLFKRYLMVRDLFLKANYETLIEEWYRRYNSIIGDMDIIFDEELIKTPSDIENYLINEGIKSIGGVDDLMMQISKLSNMSAKSKQRTRAKILSVTNKPYVLESELLQELNQKITDEFTKYKAHLGCV